MDLLAPLIKVPIGMLNMAVSETSSEQWMPVGKLFADMADAVKKIENYRCVLWQQGESDVICSTSKEEYQRKILHIRNSLIEQTELKRPWIIAKSTAHPTVYKKPDQRSIIRSAVDSLWESYGILPGPDTDILEGIYRAKKLPEGSGHFSEAGQKMAGLMWFSSIWHYLSGNQI